MFEAVVGDLDAVGALAEAAACRRLAEAAEARLLQVAARLADLHPVLDGVPAGTMVPGMQRLVPLAGEGAPQVAEFAPAELGAVLGITTAAAAALVGDALELRHRLPRTWARVGAGQLPVWRARLLAHQTMTLSARAADYVDAQVAQLAGSMTSYRAQQLVAAAIVRFDPDRAARDAAAAAESRGVRVRRGHDHGVVHLDLDLDPTDAAAFETAVAEIAGLLGTGHHPDRDPAADPDRDPGDRPGGDAQRAAQSWQVRRARAVGILADPQQALDLRTATRHHTDTTHDGEAAPPTRTGSTGRGVSRGVGSVLVYVHLSEAALATGEGPARVENLGVVTVQTVRRWVGHRSFTVRPVLHTDATTVAADCYEIPDRLREAVITTLPYCVFPWCNHPSRTSDLDHTIPYLAPDTGGPPGQTRADNLGPLCRRHHRLKTHGHWHLDQPEHGVYIWTSPHHTRYRVDATGTTPLGAAA